MKIQATIFISSMLCIALLFRVCFLSFGIPGFLPKYFHNSNKPGQSISQMDKWGNAPVKRNSKRLISNINSVLHFFKSRISENRKLLLIFLFFLISVISYVSSLLLNNGINLFKFKVSNSLLSKKIVSCSVLRI